MLIMAVIHFIGLGIGTYFGGLLAEKYSRRNIAAYAWVPIAAIVLGAPCLMLAFWVDSVPLHLVFLGIYIALSGAWVAPCFAAAQTLVPVRMRAMSTAMFFLVLNIIGLGCGPTYVGLVSEVLMPAYGELQSLRLAITSLAVVYIIGIGFFLLAAKNLRYDWPTES